MRKKGKFLWASTWYSICSMHSGYEKDCDLCNTGSWVNDFVHAIDSYIFAISPEFWRFFHNYSYYARKYIKQFQKNKL